MNPQVSAVLPAVCATLAKSCPSFLPSILNRQMGIIYSSYPIRGSTDGIQAKLLARHLLNGDYCGHRCYHNSPEKSPARYTLEAEGIKRSGARSVTQVELWLERKAGSSGRAGGAVPVLPQRGKSYGPGLPLPKPTLLCLGLQAWQITSSSPGALPQVLSTQPAHGLTLGRVTHRLPAARHGPLSAPGRRCFGPGSCSTKIKPEMIPNHFHII